MGLQLGIGLRMEISPQLRLKLSPRLETEAAELEAWG